jgi:hypothetical protein
LFEHLKGGHHELYFKEIEKGFRQLFIWTYRMNCSTVPYKIYLLRCFVPLIPQKSYQDSLRFQKGLSESLRNVPRLGKDAEILVREVCVNEDSDGLHDPERTSIGRNRYEYCAITIFNWSDWSA